MSRIVNYLGVVALLLAPALVHAQNDGESPVAEDKKPAAETTSDENATAFDTVFKTFQTLEDEINAMAEEYPKTPPAEQPALIERYQGKVKQIRELLPKLRAAALDAYEAEPNKSKQVTETLVGLLANHVRNDEYEEGLEIAKMLIEGKADIKPINTFAGIAYFCTQQFAEARKCLEAAKKDNVLDGPASQYLESLDDTEAAWKKEVAIRKAEKEKDDLPRIKLTTSKGEIIVELYENEAPQAVGNFVSLVESKFYDGLTFHRVLPGFMAQGGCPDGTGSGGPGYKIYCECDGDDYRRHFRGTLSMAHAGKDTGGSQFFLTFRPTSHLDGRHTAFGRVIEGMEVLAKIQRRDPQLRGQPTPDKIEKAEVIRKREHEYKPTKVE